MLNCRAVKKVLTTGADLNVGGGLPPIAECQSAHLILIHRNRGQAPSHIFRDETARPSHSNPPPGATTRWSTWVRWASARTSSATTAKARPASPARAASIVAFRVIRLVWSARSRISVADFAHLVQGEHTEKQHECANQGEAEEGARRDIHITKKHAGILGRCAIHAAMRRGMHHPSAVRLKSKVACAFIASDEGLGRFRNLMGEMQSLRLESVARPLTIGLRAGDNPGIRGEFSLSSPPFEKPRKSKC